MTYHRTFRARARWAVTGRSASDEPAAQEKANMFSHRIRGAAVIAATVSACVLPAVSQAASGCPVYDLSTGKSSMARDGTLTIGIRGSIYRCPTGRWVIQPDRLLTETPVTITPPVFAPAAPGS